MTAKVNTPHPLYPALQAKRDVFAAVQTTDSIREGGTRWLPKFPGETHQDYQARLGTATIDGIVSGGVDTLCGTVFYDEIDVSQVHSSIKPLLENIDNEGNGFSVFARRAFEASFDGFSAIIVDTPNVEGPVRSLEDEKRLGIRPYWRLYKACDVINWRYRVNPVSKQTELEMIVLREIGEEVKDRFAREKTERYMVLFLDGLIVRWELWLKVRDKDDEFVLEKQGVFENCTSIPVALVGSITDEPKLLVESRLEIKAYQKESSFDTIEYLSVPTLYTKGYESEEPLQLGASTHIKLPADPAAEAGYIQIDAAGHESLKGTINTIKDYIRSRLNDLASVGVGMPEKTATEATIEDRDKQARLIMWAEQLKDALELALQFTAEQMKLGKDQGGEIVLQTKWQKKQEAQEQIQQEKAEMAKAEAV
jgi:hypothetical protein